MGEYGGDSQQEVKCSASEVRLPGLNSISAHCVVHIVNLSLSFLICKMGINTDS